MESSLSSRKHQHMSVSFRQELLGVCQVKTDSRVGLEVARLAEPNFDVVQLLGRSLPHVVPNVSLSKREVGVACVLLVVWLEELLDTYGLSPLFSLFPPPPLSLSLSLSGLCIKGSNFN